MEIETERLILRPFTGEDLPDVFRYGGEPGGPEAAGWKHFDTLEEAERALADYRKENRLAIQRKMDGRVIGHIAIHEDSEDGRADTKELGYLIAADCRRQGYMREAVKAVLSELFQNGIEFVYAGCFPDNLASKALIENLGFAFDQEGSFFATFCQRELPTVEYVMTRERFWAQNG